MKMPLLLPRIAPLLALPALIACGSQPQVERIDLSDVRNDEGPVISPSPQSEGAGWSLAQGGLAIQFGNDARVAPDRALGIARVAVFALFVLAATGNVSHRGLYLPGQEIPEKSFFYRFAKKHWFFGFGAYG